MIPEDEPFDPMMFFSIPNVPGRFPLWISAEARLRLLALERSGVLAGSVPFSMSGHRADGEATCLAITRTARGEWLAASGAIFLLGFGVAPSEAGDELAVGPHDGRWSRVVTDPALRAIEMLIGS